MPIIESISNLVVDTTTTISRDGAAGASSISLPVSQNITKYRIYTTSSKTLAGNLSITASGTPENPMTYIFDYSADVDLNSNTFSILGTNIPEELSDKQMTIVCTYVNSAWVVKFKPDFEETAYIKKSALDFTLPSVGFKGTTRLSSNGTTDQELASKTIPANTLTALGDTLTFKIAGDVAVNNHVKSIYFTINGQTFLINSVKTAPNGLSFSASVDIVYSAKTAAGVIGYLQWSDGDVEMATSLLSLNWEASQVFRILTTTIAAGDVGVDTYTGIFTLSA